MQTSGDQRRENAKSYSAVVTREGGRSSIPEVAVIEPISRGVLDPPHARGMTAVGAARHVFYTGSAIEYFTWLSAKLDSIEAMPSSRVSLFFRNAS